MTVPPLGPTDPRPVTSESYLLADLRWCARPVYLDGGGGYCQRRRRHPGDHALDLELARELDACAPWEGAP